MGRKCSHCGSKGHNTRTCTTLNIRGSGLRLFGVQLQLGMSSSSSSASCSMKKSFSMDCLSASSFMSSSTPSSSSTTTSSRLSIGENLDKLIVCNGYLSDDLMEGPHERKKGMPWTEEEHRVFLLGLEKLGKGDWRGISRSFVTSRTPTQVASHAQKYFLRQNSLNNNGGNNHPHHKRLRPSIFDVVERDVSGEKIVNKSPSATTNEPFKLSSSITGFNISEQISESNQLSGGSCGSQPKSQYNSDSSFKRANVQNSTPDLELTLGAKQPLDQSNPTSRLVEPIPVV